MMVDLGAFCIDSTEVTNAQYAVFLAANVPPQSQTNVPASCGFNASYVPSQWPVPGGDADLPVVNVDWCDAFAFCAWAGKRLCGDRDGGSVTYASFTDVAASQWHYACTAAGAHPYTYGDAYGADTCNGSDYGANEPIDVASATSCHGVGVPWSGVYDLAGNVYEWEDCCDGNTGASDICRRRGGSYLSGDVNSRCDSDDTVDHPRDDDMNASTGIRCCSP
jgi:formylglycine-generating enzyme required for sulfatase activity